MRKHFLFLIAALAGGLLMPAAASQAADTDGDGLPDEVENGSTDPPPAGGCWSRSPLSLPRQGASQLDIVRVDLGNVGRDRWLWAIHTARPPPKTPASFFTSIWMPTEDGAP